MRIHIVAFYKTQLGLTMLAGTPNGVAITVGMTISNGSKHIWKIISLSFKEMEGLAAGAGTKHAEGYVYRGYTIEPADLTIINQQPGNDYFVNDEWHLTGYDNKKTM